MEFTPLYGTRFQSHYENTLSYDLVDKLGIVNSYETPKIEKIILSSSVSFKPQQVRGLGGSSSSLASQSSNNKAKSKTTFGKGGMPMQRASLENCSTQVRKALILLSGQSLRNITFRVGRPHLGIREGRLAAYQVTLRNENMYLFLERLLTEVIPKVIKTDPATLMTSTSDRRLQRTSTKLANFETGDLIPYSGQAWINDGSKNKEVLQCFFDGNGNFQLGIPDFYLFREIEQNMEFTKLNGLNVTIVTSAKNDHEARLLLSGFQAPFQW